MPHYRAPIRRPRKTGLQAPRSVPNASVPRAAAVRRLRVALVVGGVALLAGLAWFVRNPAATPAVAAIASPTPVARSSAADGAGATPTATAVTATATPAVAQPAELAPAAATPDRAAAVRNAAARSAAAARARADSMRAEFNAPAATPVTSEAPPPPMPTPPPAPVPRAPPPPDRWQQMGDAIAQCDREGGFSGFICDQRVRIQSCEGYWGRVPQCPEPPENPR